MSGSRPAASTGMKQRPVPGSVWRCRGVTVAKTTAPALPRTAYPEPMGGSPLDEHAAVAPWLERWRLAPDGAPFGTRTGLLLPVRYGGSPAMLKVITEREERDGARVMAWWAGQGAARVYELADGAVLLERATGQRSLALLAHGGDDVEATAVLCDVAATLHAKDAGDRPATVVPLERWFGALWRVEPCGDDLMAVGVRTARDLLAAQRDRVVLHGDLHHGNVLDFGGGEGGRGWLAIDPKGLYGERAFDFVNLLRNPDDALALAPGRFAAQVATIADLARLEARLLLRWTLAFSCLSAAWAMEDGGDPSFDRAVARLARAELGR